MSSTRGGRYATLAADDDQDFEELQSVVTSEQANSGLLQKRSVYADSTTEDEYQDDEDDDDSYYGSRRYSTSSGQDNEKPYRRPSMTFADPPKVLW